MYVPGPLPVRLLAELSLLAHCPHKLPSSVSLWLVRWLLVPISNSTVQLYAGFTYVTQLNWQKSPILLCFCISRNLGYLNPLTGSVKKKHMDASSFTCPDPSLAFTRAFTIRKNGCICTRKHDQCISLSFSSCCRALKTWIFSCRPFVQ